MDPAITDITLYPQTSANSLADGTEGMACDVLSKLGTKARTVHDVFGLKDGRYSVSQLLSLLKDQHDEYYSIRKLRLAECDVMLIDEISMLSVQTLLSLSAIMPDIKRNSLPLGGVQHIFVGDLFPLAPVANLINGDIANAVRETSDGSVSAETMEFLKSKCRPLPCSDRDKTVLYARNFDAWAHNIACVNRWSGKISKYLAKDSGSKEILRRSPAHEVWLPFNPSRHMTSGCRSQLPLSLAFALTVHKAQGITLDIIEVCCNNMFKPGQLAVALELQTGYASGTSILSTLYNPLQKI
ncbi:ATP-dependent DNA helicase PIF1-like [Watersipora subatra]|uniref:ATP-dependent DNA helicase PIF1-like n=1 Tax=Watersipora subatra TaxID=2589382 RepID=UPI00355BB51D